MSSIIRQLCRERTSLSEEDIQILLCFERTLVSVANLIHGDTFIDCVDRNRQIFVAAQARPEVLTSAYISDICGMVVLPQNEPAVYSALTEGLPFQAGRANTQENKSVLQDVTPIRNPQGKIIGLMIAEHDVSRKMQMERKLEALTSLPRLGNRSAVPDSGEVLLTREAHHRIKNHLQLLTSICMLRAESTKSDESRKLLSEITGMIMSISSLNDTLSQDWQAAGQNIRLDLLVQKLVDGILELYPGRLDIRIQLSCHPAEVDASLAVYILLVINELITNALEHAFDSGKGLIRVELLNQSPMASFIVSDNGSGLPRDLQPGLGLSLIMDIVQNKLNGDFTMLSDANGTKAAFTFENCMDSSQIEP